MNNSRADLSAGLLSRSGGINPPTKAKPAAIERHRFVRRLTVSMVTSKRSRQALMTPCTRSSGALAAAVGPRTGRRWAGPVDILRRGDEFGARGAVRRATSTGGRSLNSSVHRSPAPARAGGNTLTASCGWWWRSRCLPCEAWRCREAARKGRDNLGGVVDAGGLGDEGELAGSRGWKARARPVSIRATAFGSWPIVPITSGW